MSLDSLFKPQELPEVESAPDRADREVQEARKKARLRASGAGRQSTLLGGRSGGQESVARKSLLGE